MKRIHRLHQSRIGRGLLWLGDAFNKNTGFILMLIVIFFGLSIIDFQRDNQALLEGQLEQRTGRLQAVEQISKDAKENTDDILTRLDKVERLTCGILLLHDPELTKQLSPDLVDLCENEIIDRAPVTSGGSQSSGGGTSADGHNHSSSQNSTGGSTNGGGNDNDNNGNNNGNPPSVIQQLLDGVVDLIPLVLSPFREPPIKVVIIHMV